MRTSVFALVAAAYMASSGQAIALEDNLTDYYHQDTLALAQDDLFKVKSGLTKTKTKQGVTLDPNYDAADAEAKQA